MTYVPTTSGTLGSNTQGGFRTTDLDQMGAFIPTYWDGSDIADTIDASNAAKQQAMPEKRRFQAVITHTLSAEVHDASEDGTGRSTPIIPILEAEGCVRLRPPSLGVLPDGSPSFTVSATSAPAVASQMAVRRLTPTECERLQGFPDGWTAVDGSADSTRYRQLGNAVAVPVAEWLARRILAAHPPRPAQADADSD